MPAAEEAGDEGAQKRQEDGGDSQASGAQPFIRLMSSTSIVPRLRK